MTISVLDALHASEAADASELPCRANDAELWFAESPADVRKLRISFSNGSRAGDSSRCRRSGDACVLSALVRRLMGKLGSGRLG